MRAFMMIVALGAVVALSGSPTSAADIDLGQKTFAAKCASCPGPDGKGNAKMAAMMKMTIPDLSQSAANMTDSDLTKLISEGKKPMPTFGKTLSKEEIDAVVHYVKAIGKGAAAGK